MTNRRSCTADLVSFLGGVGPVVHPDALSDGLEIRICQGESNGVPAVYLTLDTPETGITLSACLTLYQARARAGRLELAALDAEADAAEQEAFRRRLSGERTRRHAGACDC